MASQEMLNALSEEDPSTFRRALNYVKGLRGSGAPLAASANEAMMTALGPQGRKAVAPVAGLANVFSLGADVRDAMEFSGDTLESLKAGDFGRAGSDALYTAAAPFAMLLPGSLGGYKKSAESMADSLMGVADDVDPSMPASLQGNRIFAGQNAVGAPLDKLDEAKKLEETGEAAETVWGATGWFRGQDGKWRFEIDDSAAVVNPISKKGETSLSAAISHPELFAAYPDLSNVPVKLRNNAVLGSSYTPSTDKIKIGEYVGPDGLSVKDRALKINEDLTAINDKIRNVAAQAGGNIKVDTPEYYEYMRLLQEFRDTKRLGKQTLGTEATPEKSVLLHEIQHAIQNPRREDFASGGSPSSIPPGLRPRGLSKRETYNRLAGEVEARNVEKRTDLTAAERADLPPRLTEDYDASDQIVNFRPEQSYMESASPGFDDESFSDMAKRGRIRGARDREKSVKSLADGSSQAQDFQFTLFDEVYESGEFTERLKDMGLTVNDNMMGTVIAGRTQAAADQMADLQGKISRGESVNAVDLGRLYGYSDEDIAAFYKQRGFTADRFFADISASSGFDDAGEGATIGLGSGGRTVPPSGVSSEVPQPLPTYPQAGQYEINTNPAGKEYPSKVHTPEEAAIAKQVGAAQRDIQAGNYTPYFDVGKRTDVDVANYPGTGAQTTLEEARPRTAKSIETYKSIIKDPEIRKALQKAFDDGALINNSENWYFVGQLEKEFIEVLGEEAGRAAFLEKFAKPMAATTAKASPTSNFRMAMYGNYLKENNLAFPDASYNVPYPVGGFGVIGNLKQHEALVPGEFFSAKQNPKRHNFARNYLGDKSVPTIDAQMTEVMSGGKLQQPKGPSYANYEQAISEQSKKIGVEPRFFQEVVWAGAKQAKEGKKYPGSQPMIEIINQSIERTSRITGLSPKEVVRLGIIESKIPLYGLAGITAGAGVAGAVSQDDTDMVSALRGA